MLLKGFFKISEDSEANDDGVSFSSQHLISDENK